MSIYLVTGKGNTSNNVPLPIPDTKKRHLFTQMK